ncbi:MAG TPA: hypothetical protein VMV74_00050, partial [Bacteroidales bacterium]|nr:hypothetical protein [Bacteroidales bacterium]
MQRIILTAALCMIGFLSVQAQDNDTMPVGIHQEQSEYYSRIIDPEQFDDAIITATPTRLKSALASSLTHKVYGWHPYWASASAYLSYDYSALTHIAYFSYEVD